MLCAYLAGALLTGLLANTLFGAWWLDPIVGLLIAEHPPRRGGGCLLDALKRAVISGHRVVERHEPADDVHRDDPGHVGEEQVEHVVQRLVDDIPDGATLEDNKRLREELAELRDELALAHGRAREIEQARPAVTRA